MDSIIVINKTSMTDIPPDKHTTLDTSRLEEISKYWKDYQVKLIKVDHNKLHGVMDVYLI